MGHFDALQPSRSPFEATFDALQPSRSPFTPRFRRSPPPPPALTSHRPVLPSTPPRHRVGGRWQEGIACSSISASSKWRSSSVPG
jgi:hypothetical protein